MDTAYMVRRLLSPESICLNACDPVISMHQVPLFVDLLIYHNRYTSI